MRDVTKPWNKTNNSRKGAGGSKNTCLGCRLHKFLVRGQARVTVRHSYSISCCLALCQIPCVKAVPGTSQQGPSRVLDT